jgi:hypothetical protein
MGLILVLGITSILTTLMIVSTTAATRAVQSSRKHVSFESSLAVAETGIDTVLARAQQAYNTFGTDNYLTPSATDGSCATSTVTWPFTSEPTADAERAWAKTQLQGIASNGACRTSTASGDFAVLKPSGRQTIYAMGWAPRYGAAEVKLRLVKAEYLFTPYRPEFAILSAQDLTIGSSTTVTAAPGADASLAAVHTNGSIIVSGGNPAVYGPVTQSGTDPTASSNKFYGNASGNVTTRPKQTIPFQGALAVWGRNHSSNPPGGWYDLCPDGTARSADGSSPCTGTVLSSGGSFRGWRFDGSGTMKKWSATSAVKTGQYSGTYYVSGADVDNPASNTGSPVPNLTVIASASTTTCPKVGGNIDWGSTDIAAPSLASTWFIADQDLRTSSNFQAGSASGSTVVGGLFVAGDQVQMQTSSNGAYGAVMAAGQCNPPAGQSLVDYNEIKNPSIYYDPNAQAPFVGIVNTTLWLEYPSA